MAHYYYPLSTRDFAFENIFSSESVSPASYYAKRAFGFDYFPVLPGINNEQAILLFSQPPVYQDENNSKFILKIAEDAINPDELVFIAEGIFAYYGTIYFEKAFLNVLFFSPKDLKVAVLKARASLPTKATEKYSAAFEIINDADCQVFPPVIASNVEPDGRMDLKMTLDKRFNHFKGFIYGLVIGQIANDRKRDLGLKMHFQAITNAFAELKSRLDNQLSIKNKSGSAAGVQSYIEKLFQVVAIAETEYDQLIFGEDIDEQALVQYLLSKLSRLKTAQQVNIYLDHLISNDELLGSSNYQKIVGKYLLDRRSSPKLFQELRLYIEQFIAVFQSASQPDQTAEELNNRIKMLLRNATEAHLEQLSNRNYNLTVDLEEIAYDITANDVTFSTSQGYLNTTSDNEYKFVVNAILKFAKANKGPAQREMILRIVEEIGSGYTKRGKETLLYQYLENKIDVYSLEKASNLVMKNFVAFVFNPDSLEKLDDFLMSKAVEERWMAFSFWGAYNGFANISRNYTINIFNGSNVKLQDYIDGFLKQYILIVINTRSNIVKSVTTASALNDEFVVYDDQPKEWITEFYNLYVADQYKLHIDDFMEVIKLTQQKDFQEVLKAKYQITKKDSQKLFNLIKKYFDPNALFH